MLIRMLICKLPLSTRSPCFYFFHDAIHQTRVNPRLGLIDVSTDGINAHTSEVITGLPPTYNLHNYVSFSDEYRY